VRRGTITQSPDLSRARAATLFAIRAFTFIPTAVAKAVYVFFFLFLLLHRWEEFKDFQH
jgi:hypothetical protein